MAKVPQLAGTSARRSMKQAQRYLSCLTLVFYSIFLHCFLCNDFARAEGEQSMQRPIACFAYDMNELHFPTKSIAYCVCLALRLEAQLKRAAENFRHRKHLASLPTQVLPGQALDSAEVQQWGRALIEMGGPCWRSFLCCLVVL
jgi:hypothetical protein